MTVLHPSDIDTTGDVWTFRPGYHKLACQGRIRVVAIGPKAQAILKQFTPANPTDYYFSPRIGWNNTTPSEPRTGRRRSTSRT